MLALRKTRAAPGLELQDVPEPPAPGRGEVLIRVAAAGICGSDLHAWEWTPGYEFMAPHMPMTLGHEFAGEVIAVGPEVDSFTPGDRVTAWPTIGCGECRACREDRRQDCQGRRILGLHCDGGFAPVVIAPASACFRLPEGLDPELAALAEPLSIADRAVETAEIGPGDAVLVLGPGPIGLGIAWMAQHRGARVMLAGHRDAPRLDCARRMGIEAVVDLSETALADAVQRRFGDKADRVIEATGAVASIMDGLSVLRSSGILVIAGIHSQHLDLPVTTMVRNKHQLRATHDTTRQAWPRVLRLLADPAHGAALSAMVTHRLALRDGPQAFELARSKTAVKILLRPGDG
ncbi:zinc-dependent alcohol dehydrogenase [Teichococcus vastitatis]|uniref:Alcohol dehydrogenase catalytic domain-containing protein n=1 Tax=Teichococcus vastitatis TaxID=2307076 RepID=A0ABS9VZ12_9PROT|nr:alcohol dehydrogenase catalytic domain-containing protein [Pseudoroseomonas vastitatis]MCI0752209.1 alcohol dehydrogenase catalytic domain-containing protein [Pseudoroseomonas vastitatis]